MTRLLAAILVVLLLGGCRSTTVTSKSYGRTGLDPNAVGYVECQETDADTVLVARFTIAKLVTEEWPIPLKLIRLVDENNKLVMVGGRFGTMHADGLSPKTGQPMGFVASIGLAEVFGVPLDPDKPRSIGIRAAFKWTDEDGRQGSIEQIIDVPIDQPGRFALSDDVTINVSFRKPNR